ncbi:SAV_915 family protein [Amycolatopsis echigonensis]|uniref:SseB family protein n=1 Tax=Amycolatopsis echigonensis TaxID=2576905 RepID=A0A2N3WMQ2_9PSEU|nr:MULTISPECIES: SAV_915 family protein [Amycolatopsis]MBB2502246.1 SseB family protein [Amycolatopsis echigonensis]PKV95160.1 type III secretion system (T3SS) SseB-like protein [Amycolatopsis niigatensis]
MRGHFDASNVVQALVRLDDVPDRLPDLVFVLVAPGTDKQSGELEVRRTERNELAVAAYSSLDRLADACGSGQPWVQVTRERLLETCRELDLGIVVFDAVLDLVPRYPEVDSREQPPLEPAEPLAEPDGRCYVPSRPVRAGQQVVELELQPVRNGRPVLLAYTSPELLAAGCGPYQPWVAINGDDLEAIANEAGAHGVLLNPVLAEESRHAAPVHDWTSRPAIGGE